MPTESRSIADDIDRLPDGRDDEPRGWRDDSGSTPIDALRRYLDERILVDEWACAETKKMSKRSSGVDLETHNRIFGRIREVVDRHGSPAARARMIQSHRCPSPHDPARNRILQVAGPLRGKVAISVEYQDPEGYGPLRFRTHSYRYDFTKVDGEWRLDNRLSLRAGERPIGGLF
jgi:hypothetical protein